MPADDDLIEAAPCPTCRSPLTVAVSDLGHLVECPGCGTQFRARRPGSDAVSPPLPPGREERGGDRWGEDRDDRDREADDRPRRSSGRTTGRDRGFGPKPERDRDSGYDRDSDDRYEGRRRPRKSGAATALGVVNLVYAGLVLLCGCGSIFLSFWLRDLLANAGPPPPNVKPGEVQLALTLLLVAGGVYILGAGLFLAAGLTMLRGSPTGRTLSYLCVGFAVLGVVFQVVSFVIGAADGDADDDMPQQMCGIAIALIVWIGYVITALILLSKSAARSRGRYAD